MLKSWQNENWTCGPAVLRAMIADTEDVIYSEKGLDKLADSNEVEGTTPPKLLRAARELDPRVISWSCFSKAQFDNVRRDHYLALLISTGPNYGHWVLALPGDSDEIIIDDPWDSHLWSMTWDQLADCWHWEFPDGVAYYRMALISDYVPEDEMPDESKLKIKPWNLPKLADFPKNYKWPARAKAPANASE